jgi:hypothetical protein
MNHIDQLLHFIVIPDYWRKNWKLAVTPSSGKNPHHLSHAPPCRHRISLAASVVMRPMSQTAAKPAK